MATRVSVGKTAPVPLGQQPAANSLPVVFAEDQAPLPVEEQNKIQSEVALSLLGIPRSEVALGIFADVNTYDVNPSEWAQFPLENTKRQDGNGIISGVEHIPEEAGARLVAPDVSTTILTSKRFFRYQPGRVSASTMGVKMNVTQDPEDPTDAVTSTEVKNARKGAPSIKKWGIFDKFDGYYFEIANAGVGNDFRCVRRTQAIIPSEPVGYAGTLSWFNNGGNSSGEALFNPSSNFGVAGLDPVIVRDGLVYVAAAIYDPSLVYSPENVVSIDSSADPAGELKKYQSDSNYALRLATYNGTSWSEIMETRKFQFPFDQSKTITLDPKEDSLERGYIRMDAHCNFYKTISNLNRKADYNGDPSDKPSLSSTEWGTAGSNITQYNQAIIDNTWDTAPSTTNQDKKVWHLLVNTQGANSRITDAQHSACPNLPTNVKNRVVTNGNVTLKEWFNICVPKPYRMVYEWRPCRAMFSGDKLDGTTSEVRWSDVNTSAEDTIIGGGSVINLPGDKILEPNGEVRTITSAYNIDFTKVTMWKIEFSWYGAVGAIFLCYVPVSGGEARWVRVHHIRASNQHSVASLGNATLPITYLTHGGVNSGLEETDIGNTLVKYGASYYIDGGDKGTVRLLSKASDFRREVPKGFYDFSANSHTVSGSSLTYSEATHPLVNGEVAVGLMGAYLDGDSTCKVKWVSKSGTNITLHFTSPPSAATNAKRLVIPRAQRSLMTVRTKDFIYNRDGKPVRNRLQIYPTKYGLGATGGQSGELMTINAVKNPLFIVTNSNASLGTNVLYPNNQNNGFVSIQDLVNNTIFYADTGNSTLPVEIGFNSAPLEIEDGEYRYGYFLGTTVEADANTTNPSPDSFEPILGKLYRVGNQYFFEKYFSYPETIYIAGNFLPEKHLVLSNTGVFDEHIVTSLGILSPQTIGSSDQTKWDKLEGEGLATWEDITRLSGVRISQDFELTPIAETGVEILSYYASNGGYQFDLQDYFAYNKEYLSFPLTDQVDIINFQAHYNISDEVIGSTVPATNPFKVNNALTWEEQ